MNTETLQWSTAADLPKPLCRAPAVVCGGQVYILGETKLMYMCSLQALSKSQKSFLASLFNTATGTRVWKEVAAPPVTETTCVSIHDRLLAVGGIGSNKKTHNSCSHV